MQIIPVIDIKAGQVVLARFGQRQNYRPLSTPLCQSSHIEDVINAYLSIYTFSHFYIADLDALMNTGSNHQLINSVFKLYPNLIFMIDCGSVNPLYMPQKPEQHIPVIGTESTRRQSLKSLKLNSENFILSLDFSAQHDPMGEPSIYKSPDLWPKRIVIMTLGLVGKNCGPDLQKLTRFHQSYPAHNFIAAGGIRNKQDLKRLKLNGIKTALVASALHNGNLTSHDIQQISEQNYV